MTIIIPQTTDKMNSPSHSFLHRVITVDTGSSQSSIHVDADDNVGIGRTDPLNKVDIAGIDISDITEWGVQKNGLTFSGANASDRSIYWNQAGVDKWSAGTYRNEDGRFWYLFNEEGQLNPLVISNTGRIGVNQPSNYLDYHARFSVGTGLNDLEVSGIYLGNFIIIYEVEVLIENAGATPDIMRWRKSLDDGLTWTNYDGASFNASLTPYEIDNGVECAFGVINGHTVGDKWEFSVYPQLPNSTLSIFPTKIDECQTTSNYTAGTPTFIDRTINVNRSDLSTDNFDILEVGLNNSAIYIGTKTKTNSFYFNLAARGEDVTLVAEYWNGSAWTTLNSSNGFNDLTYDLSETGEMRFDPLLMTGFALSNPINAEDSYLLYWIRLRHTGTILTAPVCGTITKQGDHRFSVFSGAQDHTPSFSVKSNGSVDVNQNLIQNLGGIYFDTTPSDIYPIVINPTEGLCRWNATVGTLDLGMKNGVVTQQVGLESYVAVANKTGASIGEGLAVYSTGRFNNKLSIALARSNTEATSRIVGVTTHPLSDNEEGFVTNSGYINGIKTDYTGDGIWGTTWVANDLLYVSNTNAGVLTNVKPVDSTVPTEAARREIIGRVGEIHATSGNILVEIDRHPVLEDIYLDVIPSASQTRTISVKSQTTNQTGGNHLIIRGGTGKTLGGDASLIGGHGSSAARGGHTWVKGGAAGYDQDGGNTYIYGGIGAGGSEDNGIGGSIYIRPGVGVTGNANKRGKIYLEKYDGTFKVELKTSDLDADYIYTLPNKAGTVAMTSDITGGGQTLYECIVAPSGGDYTTLGDALAAGKTRIFVRNGIYAETGETTITGDVVIFGESRDGVIIDVDGTTNDRFILGNGSLEIQNVTFQGPAGGTDYVLDCVSARSKALVYFSNVYFRLGGLSFYLAGSPLDFTIVNCTIEVGSGYGILMIDSSMAGAREYKRIFISGNKLTRNQAVAGSISSFIYISSPSNDITVSNNQVVDTSNSAHTVSSYLYVSGDYRVTRVSICGNLLTPMGFIDGISVDGVCSFLISGNSIEGNGGGSGIKIGSYNSGNKTSLISNNTINAICTVGVIDLSSTARYLNITGNISYRPTYFIKFGGTDNDHINISGNQLSYPYGTERFITGTSGNNVNIDETNMGILPTEVKKLIRVKNTSGATLDAGVAVIMKSVAAGYEVTTTTTVGDNKIIGVTVESIVNDGSYGYIQVLGKTTLLKVNGTTDIAIGDYLSTYSVAGISAKATAGDMVFAMALEAYTADDSSGVIDALLINPRLI